MAKKYPTCVKWGKKTFDLELDPMGGVAGLKSELQGLTGVPSDRMKIMPKSKGLWKGVLKDELDLSSLDLERVASPIQLLLMGSASLPVEPRQKTVFLEDLPPEEHAKMVEPSGLVNLGNTCYLNSVLQCLRVVPHLRDALAQHSPAARQPHALLLASLRDTLFSLDRSAQSLPPSHLVMATKMAFPQFAQTGPQGQPMQQDAEEFYSSLMTLLAAELKGDHLLKAAFVGANQPGVSPPSQAHLNGATNVIDAVFGLKMEETLTCDELASSAEAMDTDNAMIEPPVKSHDLHRKLVCNIQGGSDTQSQVNINHIAEGIALSLTGKVEKYSQVLGRNAQWTRRQKIARLGPVIVVQFGRFYWKSTPDSQDHAGVKCKVMKPVAFHSILDVYEFCSDDVQKTLKVARDQAAQDEEDRVAKKLKGEDVHSIQENKGQKSGDGDVTMTNADEATAQALAEAQDDEEAAALQAALAMSVQEEEESHTDLSPIGPGLPSNFQGLYELFGVVTHKGRDADGGHYMGWVKADNTDRRSEINTPGSMTPLAAADKFDAQMNGNKREKIADTDEDNDDWFVFDDDEVSPCKTEDILKLKGGGDWHMSYLNFYRAKK